MQQGITGFGAKARRFAGFFAAGSLLLSPVLVPAVAAQLKTSAATSAADWATRFTPAGVDSRLAEQMRSNAMRQSAFPFTPAGLAARPNGTLTVAVRADAGNAVSVRNALAQIEAGNGSTLRLNNSNYQLTAARGWQAFTLPSLSQEVPRLSDIVGKGGFKLDDDSKKPSRFGTDVRVDTPRTAAPTLRGNGTSGDYRVNVGGSLRVAKGVDVTAGVRYTRETDRVDPALPQADNEAVYVGTKIRF